MINNLEKNSRNAYNTLREGLLLRKREEKLILSQQHPTTFGSLRFSNVVSLDSVGGSLLRRKTLGVFLIILLFAGMTTASIASFTLVSVSHAHAQVTPEIGDFHTDHLNDPTDDFPNDYAPMVIPFNGKNVIIAPVIMDTTLENNVFQPNYYPCKLAQTFLIDDDWSNNDAKYRYLFEDWTDYDWNDINVSLYATSNDVITLEIRLDSRHATWKNPFGVEITPEGLMVDVLWNSTDYPTSDTFRVNADTTEDLELFSESNPGKDASLTITLTISPVASFFYSPLYPKVGDEVTFDASSSTSDGGYIANYTWSFGDSNVTTVTSHPTITYRYDNPGVYTVSLNVTDSRGLWNTKYKTITVTPRMYALAITATSGGTTNPSPSVLTYPEGTLVEVTATASTNFALDHWELDHVNVGSNESITVTMNANHTLHAVFTRIGYTLTITSTIGGTTNPPPGDHAYSIGSIVLVTATPRDGYIFDCWILDDSNPDIDHPIYVTMDGDHNLTAVFRELPPPPVGGHAVPIEKPRFLVPKIDMISWIGLAFVFLAAVIFTIILIRHGNKFSKWKS